MKSNHRLAWALLTGILILAASGAWAQEKPAPPDVDGTIWMRSTPTEKRAFLFGAGSAIVLEYYIRTKHNEQPSRFVQGWVEVLKDKSWADIEKVLDQYYTEHPNKMQEHVFAVLWHQVIEPKMKS